MPASPFLPCSSTDEAPAVERRLLLRRKSGNQQSPFCRALQPWFSTWDSVCQGLKIHRHRQFSWSPSVDPQPSEIDLLQNKPADQVAGWCLPPFPWVQMIGVTMLP